MSDGEQRRKEGKSNRAAEEGEGREGEAERAFGKALGFDCGSWREGKRKDKGKGSGGERKGKKNREITQNEPKEASIFVLVRYFPIILTRFHFNCFNEPDEKTLVILSFFSMQCLPT